MTDFILANAKLILKSEVLTGGLVIRDGAIADIFTGTDVPTHAQDCHGDFISAGLIELHTDNLERHLSPRPGVAWPRAAAILAHDRELASVGITTVFDALRVGSVVSEERSNYGKYARETSDLILKHRAARHLTVSHFLHLRAEVCSETLIEELAEFTPEDRIGIVSLMDHTPGQRQFREVEKLSEYLRGKYGMTEADIAAHYNNLKGIQAQFGAEHEAAVVAAAARLGAVLASHDDTTVADVGTSAGHGIQLAEFPTTMEAATACHAQGIKVIMGAPNYLRGGSHSGNVAAHDLADAGLLDIMSSDYAPSSLMMAAVRFGLESGDMAKGFRVATAAPAEAVHLTDRGEIAPGKRADMLRFRVEEDLPILRQVWVQGRAI